MLGLRVTACAIALLSVAATAAGIAAGWKTGENVPLWILPFVAVAFLGPLCVGLLIAVRQPRNAVAWAMLVGVFLIVLTLGPAFELVAGHGWWLQVSRATWPLLYAWPIAVAFVFPDGRLLSPRWRWVVAAAVTSFVGFMSVALLDPSPFEGADAAYANPIAGNRFGEVVVGAGIWVPFWLGILASLFAGALSMWLRFRRSTGVQRLQVMWLAWAAALIPLGLLLCASGWFLGLGAADVIVFPFLLLMQAAVSAAVGIAVVRYRLYAIERLVNRTLVYAVLTVVLAGVYVGCTAGLGVLVGRGSEWVTALATLAVAIAFRPLRRRVQSLVDRRFDRDRYEAVRKVQSFEQQIREGRRAPEEIGAVLSSALGDPLAELFFWLPASETFADAGGTLVDALPDDGRAHAEIHHEGVRTAALLHDPSLLVRTTKLEEVLGAAALSVEIARLRVEVRRQLAEVRASRQRIVEAGYEERRRLERDLHDGAQQRLVSLGIRVRRMQRTLPREAGILAPALDEIVLEVGSAIGDLRQIAAGVRPARLDDGLAAALRDLASSSPVPVTVDAPVGRVAASVEAAAYFVACEALTNAVKHASASGVVLSAARENGTLRVSVTDDGVGGAVTRRGSGLAGLRDRVAAHGGTLEVRSPRGGGTQIEVSLPCGS